MKKDQTAIAYSLFLDKIIDEVKLRIVHDFLNDMNNYDGRFDSEYILRPLDIVQKITDAKVSDVFINDCIREIAELTE